MDGVPIFSMFPWDCRRGLARISGVFNSTTNVVLTEIERGLSFDEAVKRAQAMGIAETDPSRMWTAGTRLLRWRRWRLC